MANSIKEIYEEKTLKLVNRIIDKARIKLNNTEFRGILLYNCGQPQGKDISNRVKEQSGKRLNWIVEEISPTTTAKKEIKKLPKRRKRVKGCKEDVYLLIDYLSIKDPIPYINKIYCINIGEHFEN